METSRENLNVDIGDRGQEKPDSWTQRADFTDVASAFDNNTQIPKFKTQLNDCVFRCRQP